MILVITLEKDFDNEGNMRSSRDAIKEKAESIGYRFHCVVSE